MANKLFGSVISSNAGIDGYIDIASINSGMGAMTYVMIANQNNHQVQVRFAVGTYPPQSKDFILYDCLIPHYGVIFVPDNGVDAGEHFVFSASHPKVSCRVSGFEDPI